MSYLDDFIGSGGDGDAHRAVRPAGNARLEPSWGFGDASRDGAGTLAGIAAVGLGLRPSAHPNWPL